MADYTYFHPTRVRHAHPLKGLGTTDVKICSENQQHERSAYSGPLNSGTTRRIDKLSGSVLSDLAAHYEKYGRGIFDQMLKTNPTAYFNSLIQLAKIVRIDLRAEMSMHLPKPQSIDEILDRVEEQTGASGRAAFVKFLEKIKPPPAS